MKTSIERDVEHRLISQRLVPIGKTLEHLVTGRQLIRLIDETQFANYLANILILAAKMNSLPVDWGE